MKKLLAALASVALAFSLVACSSGGGGGEAPVNTDEKDAQAVAEKFLDNTKAGKIEDLYDLMTEDCMNDEGATIVTSLEDFNNVLDDLGMGDDFNADAQQFLTNIFGGMIRSYNIDNVTVTGSSATVKATVTGIDIEKLDFDAYDDEMNDVMDKYIDDNMDHIQDIISNSATEEEAQEKLMNELTKVLFDFMNGVVEKQDSVDSEWTFNLVKDGDAWLINSTEVK